MDAGEKSLEALRALGEHVAASLPDAVVSQNIAYGELALTLKLDRYVETVAFLRDDPQCRFVCFIDLTAVDYTLRRTGSSVRFGICSACTSPVTRTCGAW